MTLRDYLDSTGETMASFARRLGVSYGTMTKIVYGAREPGLALAILISARTNGMVQPADLLKHGSLRRRKRAPRAPRKRAA